MLAVVNCCEGTESRDLPLVNLGGIGLLTAANRRKPLRRDSVPRFTSGKSPVNHCEQAANKRKVTADNLQTTANKRSANKVTKVYTKFFCSYLMTSIRKMSYVCKIDQSKIKLFEECSIVC